jgi:hypothetical protein
LTVDKAGELLKAMEKAKPNPDGANQYTKGKEVRSENSTEPKTLAELGISKKQSSDWKKLAAVLITSLQTARRLDGSKLSKGLLTKISVILRSTCPGPHPFSRFLSCLG